MSESALTAVQRRLEAFYGLESGPDVSEFVREGTRNERETLFIKNAGDALEVALVLPSGSEQLEVGTLSGVTDLGLQVVEGISHFVYIVERARTELPATRLELELQAEVDKFVWLGVAGRQPCPQRTRHLVHHLYERVSYFHRPESELGQRYRTANSLAARFVSRLAHRSSVEVHQSLRTFYRSGQTDKIHMARAA